MSGLVAGGWLWMLSWCWQRRTDRFRRIEPGVIIQQHDCSGQVIFQVKFAKQVDLPFVVVKDEFGISGVQGDE